ncbi:MAG TPA: hypothetical protein VGI39_07770 [Polyangiaceae bacterium]|jgi:hypothetical protein
MLSVSVTLRTMPKAKLLNAARYTCVGSKKAAAGRAAFGWQGFAAIDRAAGTGSSSHLGQISHLASLSLEASLEANDCSAKGQIVTCPETQIALQNPGAPS